MPNPSGVPAFGGYVAIPSAHGDALLLAYWQDGSAARFVDRMDEGEWVPMPRPDFASLFPERVTRTGLDMTPQDKIAEMVRTLPLPFRGDLPAQPRPDDADDREYPPARGGRDD